MFYHISEGIQVMFPMSRHFLYICMIYSHGFGWALQAHTKLIAIINPTFQVRQSTTLTACFVVKPIKLGGKGSQVNQ